MYLPRYLVHGRLKSGILTRYACATKTNALGNEKIIVISFVGSKASSFKEDRELRP